MSVTDVPLIEQSARVTRLWLEELAEELGRPHDQRYALHVLRAFLHTLRDRLPVPETAHLGAQLPETIRGIYYEEWRPSQVPQRYHDRDTFFTRLAGSGLLTGETEAAFGAEAVVRVLARHLSRDELAKVSEALPRDIAELLTSTGKEHPGVDSEDSL